MEQFHRLCEAVPEQRLALIDGEVLQQLRVESPLDLGSANEPEPDLALVARREDNDWEAHPTAADTALVIEVSDTTSPLTWTRKPGSMPPPGSPPTG